ncbi:hypothetical protein DPMN_112372 [Dreissena polymorpha]|uniref:Uncharacterized protein n=1 Tax=Dreissena polymorpha TaxID=45954 RepID=A0A9D4KGC9_DREPO|nr:hypothetical protein DPMN_112372 [Dreissena polymorpha]
MLHIREGSKLLPSININIEDKFCILSTFDFVCNPFMQHDIPELVTFEGTIVCHGQLIANMTYEYNEIQILLRSETRLEDATCSEIFVVVVFYQN